MFDNYQNNILAENLINEIDILNAFVSKPIIKEDNKQKFNDNENEIIILLKEKINEISILKKINFSYNFNSSFNQYIITFVENKYGNLFFKEVSFRSLPIECFIFIYNLIKCKFITFLKNHYSSYFCQHLFFSLTLDIRKEIIIDICNNMDILYKNSNGQCSIIFLLENELTCEERLLFINLIRPNIMKLIWKPMFMRIIECILIRFPLKEVNFIIDYCIENMYEFLKLREGYFVIRVIIKSAKLPNLQEKILDYIEYKNNFYLISKSLNGSLILQCIIYNFPINKVFFIKICSKHLNNNEIIENENITNKLNSDMNDSSIKRLILNIIKNYSYWSNKFVIQVVECAIKKSPLFEIVFMELLKSNINLLFRILQLSNCFKIFELMFINFSMNNNKYLLKLLKQISYTNKNIFLINFIDKVEILLSSKEGNLILYSLKYISDK